MLSIGKVSKAALTLGLIFLQCKGVPAGDEVRTDCVGHNQSQLDWLRADDRKKQSPVAKGTTPLERVGLIWSEDNGIPLLHRAPNCRTEKILKTKGV